VDPAPSVQGRQAIAPGDERAFPAHLLLSAHRADADDAHHHQHCRQSKYDLVPHGRFLLFWSNTAASPSTILFRMVVSSCSGDMRGFRTSRTHSIARPHYTRIAGV